MAFGKRRYWMDRELCTFQIAELNRAQKLAKYLICENVKEKKSWDNGLMDLLCEYYTHTKQMIKYLLEIIMSETKYNDSTKKEEYLISGDQGAYLKSQAILLKVVDHELNYNHGISFVLH